jgi:hypothetical protein
VAREDEVDVGLPAGTRLGGHVVGEIAAGARELGARGSERTRVGNEARRVLVEIGEEHDAAGGDRLQDGRVLHGVVVGVVQVRPPGAQAAVVADDDCEGSAAGRRLGAGGRRAAEEDSQQDREHA